MNNSSSLSNLLLCAMFQALKKFFCLSFLVVNIFFYCQLFYKMFEIKLKYFLICNHFSIRHLILQKIKIRFYYMFSQKCGNILLNEGKIRQKINSSDRTMYAGTRNTGSCGTPARSKMISRFEIRIKTTVAKNISISPCKMQLSLSPTAGRHLLSDIRPLWHDSFEP